MKTSHLLKTILFSIFTIQIGFAQSVILDPLNGIFAKSYQDSLAGTRINIKSKLYNEEISFYLSGHKVANFKDNTFQLNSNGNDIFIGDSVGLNDDGSFHYNVAMGYHAFKTNTTGGGNVGIGRSSLEKNETGSNNVSIGS
ncbi:hypothetical protein [Arcticibacterium luteifluviistationis]|uniref:Uncharacterized protein n=1 Tax=Arcticibacterium luteifluviistationis TaxID=1784714 RepID=A0A2Z4G8K2_9BACT|nr:hypothetical protein [Arcticibacterium luteifluviistationis]AWV97549.1 hypothetical protein DJ013_04960 [Arcticibacterium luteifluviistationis]